MGNASRNTEFLECFGKTVVLQTKEFLAVPKIRSQSLSPNPSHRNEIHRKPRDCSPGIKREKSVSDSKLSQTTSDTHDSLLPPIDVGKSTNTKATERKRMLGEKIGNDAKSKTRRCSVKVKSQESLPSLTVPKPYDKKISKSTSNLLAGMSVLHTYI